VEEHAVAHVPPLRREELPQYEALFGAMEQHMGFVPNGFLTMARRPGLLDAVQGLMAAVFAGSVPPRTKTLVALMASYGSGCRYCQAHQASSLLLQGIDEETLAAVAAFETSERFSAAERAAMRLALASGQQPNTADTRHFEELRRHFDESEIVEIVAVIAAFGFLNRWHETMATELEQEPMAAASRTLDPLGWEPGRHASP
jgi:uncharacterized peroxidase-related enzyme